MTKGQETAADARQASDDAASLSVIVPVYNGTNDLQRCLAALAASQFDDFDVLVVDDGSTEPVEPLATAHGFGYMRIEGPNGPAHARNVGVAHTSSDYIVFVDADVCVHPDALRRFAEIFAANPEIAAVIGTYDEAPMAHNFLSVYKNIFHHYVHQHCHGEIASFWSGCGAIRREIFAAHGGFDVQRYRRPAIEDIELGTWMSADGRRIVLDDRIKATHLKRWTFWKLLKTDIFDRGVPWIRLMWRAGAIANTLNVLPAQRLSVVLTYLMGSAILAAPWWPILWVGAAGSALAVTVINFDFYRYFANHCGPWFALRVVPLHWLYFGCCGFCVVWGTLSHYVEKMRSPASAPPSSRHSGPRSA